MSDDARRNQTAEEAGHAKHKLYKLDWVDKATYLVECAGCKDWHLPKDRKNWSGTYSECPKCKGTVATYAWTEEDEKESKKYNAKKEFNQSKDSRSSTVLQREMPVRKPDSVPSENDSQRVYARSKEEKKWTTQQQNSSEQIKPKSSLASIAPEMTKKYGKQWKQKVIEKLHNSQKLSSNISTSTQPKKGLPQSK